MKPTYEIHHTEDGHYQLMRKTDPEQPATRFGPPHPDQAAALAAIAQANYSDGIELDKAKAKAETNIDESELRILPIVKLAKHR